MKKKKIAIFTHGGIGTGNLSQGFPLITQIVNRLADNVDITVFSLVSFNEEFRPEKYKAYCVPERVTSGMLRWIHFIRVFIKVHRKDRFQVLYSFWGYPTGTIVVLLGKVFKVPVIVNILGAESANIPEINYGHLRKIISRKLILWTCRQATELVAVSACQLKLLAPYGLRRHAKVIPWGVSKELFRPRPKELKPPLKIIHVANLTEVKDQHTLLKAFQLIRHEVPAKLRMVGPDFLNGEIQKLATELGVADDVEFIGFVPHKNIPEHYDWADVFMLTSLSEGQNNSITEAMMCGLLPASASVGIMDDLGDRVGVVVKPRDYQSMASNLLALYAQPDAWKERQQRAQEWANTYDLDWTINQLLDVIHGV